MLGYKVEKTCKIPEWLAHLKWEKQALADGGCILVPGYSKRPLKFTYSNKVRLFKTLDDSVKCFYVSEGLEPEDIVKPTTMGKPVTIGDNPKNWIVPRIRSIAEGIQLPRSIRLVDGERVHVVRSEYLSAARWAYPEDGQDSLINGSRLTNAWVRYTQENSDDAAKQIWQAYADILSINYHISIMDVAIYGLVDQMGVESFMDQALDLTAWTRYLEADSDGKKKLSSQSA